ncbi:MAG TPA: aspartate 1-decarboxylase [Chloroflexia bacterium]|nr:aspartate 1-decarboxylase [Chloroflexia bacterium]
MSIFRTLLRSKIQHVTVTRSDVYCEGSLVVDPALLEAAHICPFEQVEIVDATNGQHLETYVLAGARGSGEIQINGAAARLVLAGELVSILAYDQITDPLPEEWNPRVVLVTPQNHIRDVRSLCLHGGSTVLRPNSVC